MCSTTIVLVSEKVPRVLHISRLEAVVDAGVCLSPVRIVQSADDGSGGYGEQCSTGEPHVWILLTKARFPLQLILTL
jgi:hypothetical protein